MYNKSIRLCLCILCTIGIVGCTRTGISQSHTKVEFSEGNITLLDDVKQSVNLLISIGREINYSIDVNTNQKTSILKLLKVNTEKFYDIALLLAKDDGNIDIHLNIPDIFDTSFTYHLVLNDSLIFSTTVLQGKCAILSGVFDSENVESDIIKCLYRNNMGNVGEKTIEKMRLYLKELNRGEFTEYTTRETIPIITSFIGMNYKVSSDLVADNYYLFACKSENEIEEFVEEMISVKFDGAVHSLNQLLPCYRAESTSGTICIFLIGIDNDWKYKVAPIGLINIDNIAPNNHALSIRSNVRFNKKNSDIILNKNRIRIIMPSNIPTITGYASLGTNDWGGNGLSCKVNFVVTFGGDVKSITLKREGALTEFLGRATKTIDLQKETSPYLFTFELHLEDGDNYVPVIITDLRGNKTEFKYNVACEITRNNSPQINIDNEVNVWN